MPPFRQSPEVKDMPKKEVSRFDADTGYISRISSIVSLPLKKTPERKIVKRNGNVEVTFTALGECMPYGKLPRNLDAIVATLILTNDSSWDTSSRKWVIGKSFYEFAEHRLGITRGGNQYRRLRNQFNYWLRTAYTITNLGEDQIDSGGQFVVAEAWHVPWVDAEEWAQHPEDKECWIQFSEMFVKKVVKENPVPVDFRVLRELNKIKSPLSLDIYLWLNRRMSYLRQPSLVTWEQLRGQFGSSAQTMKKFKQTFKAALVHVRDAWDGLDLTVSDSNGVTLFPSSTHVPTLAETRKKERNEEFARRASSSHSCSLVSGKSDDEGFWQNITGWGKVFTSQSLFDVGLARDHLEGISPQDECPFCLYDHRNREFHGSATLG
ncbi:replicase [Bifidobacterium adolescentis ATCC 15703]|uniref:Replicase n=2 Tax=Bifidobacterium adolescentis TaxID=1680 RepID=A1A2T9_BIFAA|nr:replicase [Bifidobacterium adolescentis ATCC 15703]